MRKSKLLFFLLPLLVLFIACKQDPKANEVEFIILQVNDVYEINALEGGNVGGMARVKTLLDTLKAENPHVYTMLAGDFVNPSAMGTVEYEGEALKGRQMVDIMNQVGVDYVTFGNHEFDLKENELQERINESEFTWITSNVDHVTNSDNDSLENDTLPWMKTRNGTSTELPRYEILEIKDGEKAAKVGIISVTLHNSNPDYAALGDINGDALATYNEIKDQCDFVVALTHLAISEDQALAEAVPGLKLIMGGHEHQAHHSTIGETEIYKADANAKSAYIHRISYNTTTQAVTIASELKMLDHDVELNPEVQASVEKWVEIVYDGYEQMGFKPNEIVCTVTESLDGRESTNRSQRTNLGTLIAGSMYVASPEPVDCGLLNSGSIRIDDELTGAISEYDIIRILPFGGAAITVPLKGKVLKAVMDLGTSEELYGNGGFLQYDKIEQSSTGWTIEGQEIEDNKTYNVAGTQYFFYKEKAYNEVLADLRTKPQIEPVGDLQKDLRSGLISYMKEVYN